MRIAFIDRVDPLLAERLSAAGHTCVALHGHTEPELATELADVEGIIVRSRALKSDLLSRAPRLHFVGRVGSGMENIDRAYCESRGVRLFNSPEGNRDGVAETAMMLLLMLLKNAAVADAQVRRGLWLREENRGFDLQGRTVGIIGFGHMGAAFAQRLQGFGVRLLAHDKYLTGYAPARIEEVSLERLQEESDVVSLHIPLTAETHHYVNAQFLACMRRPFHLINTARGGLVHSAALLDAIDDGRVLGAGLDVLEFERADLDGLDPAVEPHTLKRLLTHDRLVLTPHIAGVTHEGRWKMAAVLADKILREFPHV